MLMVPELLTSAFYQHQRRSEQADPAPAAHRDSAADGERILPTQGRRSAVEEHLP